MLFTAGIIEVITGKRGAPGFQHPHQLSARQRIPHRIIRNECQAKPRYGGINSLAQAVKG